jgi:hypothetical protein
MQSAEKIIAKSTTMGPKSRPYSGHTRREQGIRDQRWGKLRVSD